MNLIDKSVVGHSDALYDSTCPTCGDRLEFKAFFDADGTTYSAKCCGKVYRLRPATVTVAVEESLAPI